MAKRKKEAVETQEPKRPGLNEAELFAFQRRIPCYSKEDGERLLELVSRGGTKPRIRGNANLTYVYSPFQFVIDLTK